MGFEWPQSLSGSAREHGSNEGDGLEGSIEYHAGGRHQLRFRSQRGLVDRAMVSQQHKTALVTGATDGIGRQTALELLKSHGFHVLLHGRTEPKAVAACEALGGSNLTPVWGDFEELGQVRALAQQVVSAAPSLDVVVNNAGVFMKSRRVTSDGYEMTFQVNHLAPFALTHGVLPALKAAGAARVVNVSSMTHQRGKVDLKDLNSEQRFDGYSAYSSSKLMNIFFTHELARRLAGTGITTSALHPGVVSTKLLQTGWGTSGASLAAGAKTSVFCATAPELEGVSGKYYSDAREVPCAPNATDPKLEKLLYLESCRLLALAPL